MSQMDLFHVTENEAPEKPKPVRRQPTATESDAEQLQFYGEPEPEIYAAHRMRFWDLDGLEIRGLPNNWYRYRSGSTTAREKSLAKVRRRFDQITSTGLVGFAEIVTNESNLAEYQYNPGPIVLKRYPESQITIKE